MSRSEIPERRRSPRILPASEEAIATAADLLRHGGLVAFPTETVYGLGAMASDREAVQRIFRAKGRPADHPLIVHLGEREWIERWADHVPAEAEVLARAFWPGPLTLILRRAGQVPDVVTGGATTVGLRMPAHEVAQALIRAVGDGLAAPSANRFGRISPTRAEHVLSEFALPEASAAAPETSRDAGRIDLILDGGPCLVGLESTIVDLSSVDRQGGVPRLLRPGGVPVEAIQDRLGAPLAPWTDGAPRAPGTLASHYAPAVPTLALQREALVERLEPGDAVLAFSGMPIPGLPAPGGTGEGRRGRAWTVLPDDPVVAARELYAALRDLDASNPTRILIELPPDTPPWRAVRDRIVRAAARR